TNNGSLDLENGASVATNNALTNNGTIYVDSGSYYNSTGSSLSVGHGTGSLTNNNYMQIGNYLMSTQGGVSAGTFTNSGTVSLYGNSNAAGTLTVSNLVNGGAIYNNSGAINIGAQASSGGLAMGDSGTLTENIAGMYQFGVINLNGPVSLGGTLDVATLSGFTFTKGESFDFMNLPANSLSGQFSTLAYGNYSGNGIDALNIGGGLALLVNYETSNGQIVLDVVGSTITENDWIGPSDNWDNPTNSVQDWSSKTPPNSSQDVFVGNYGPGGTITYNDSSDTINSLTVSKGTNSNYTVSFNANTALTTVAGVTINSGGEIDVETSGAALTSTGALANNGGTLKVGGDGGSVTVGGLSNTGEIDLNSNGSLNLNGGAGTYDNAGNIAMAGGTISGVTGTESLTNEGVIGGNGSISNLALINNGRVTPNGTLTITPNSSGFSSSGTVSIGQGDTLAIAGGNSIYTQAAGSTTVDGTLLANVLNINGGTLNGTGTIAGAVNNNGGMIHGGDSPGTLKINGNFTQGVNGTLFTQIDSATSLDLLQISGTATLGGQLQIDNNFYGDLGLTQGKELTILTAAGGISGEFSYLSDLNFDNGLWSWSVKYDTNSVDLVAMYNGTQPPTSTPEPATMLLLLFGLPGLAWSVRRKMRTGAR
ncbi:MAG: beta strand repeat-containing protein, partial [Syntrophobacteraceae bacterium]